MFFVLSGFLITYRYFNDYPIHFKRYMVNRIARIYPMYFLLTTAVFLVAFFQSGVWNWGKTVEAALSFTMTKALFLDYFLVGIPQGWTLTLEEMFYLTAPLYFILIRKNKWWLYIIPLLIFSFGFGLHKIFENIQNLGGFLQTGIYNYIIEFFAGIGLAIYISKPHKKTTFQYTTTGLSIIIIYLLCITHLREFFMMKNSIGQFLEMGILSCLGIAPLLYGLIHENTFIKRFLSLPIMVLLGKASYVFYLIHKGFIPIFIDEQIWNNKLFIFVLLNLIAIILYKYAEEPLNHLIRKKICKIKTK